jgi:hypothetical protein
MNDDVGWLGVDFRRLPAASVQLDRTMIEISALEGTFDDQEFQALCLGLQPAVPSIREQIRFTPLADLCYQSRHREPPVAEPVSLWFHRRNAESLPTVLHKPPNVPPGLPGKATVLPSRSGYQLDTVFVFGTGSEVQEADYVYTHASNKNFYIRVLASPVGAATSIRFPPSLDRQPCLNDTLCVNGRTCYHAFPDAQIGPHEVVWQKGGENVMLLIKPARWTDRRWFLSLLEQLVG